MTPEQEIIEPSTALVIAENKSQTLSFVPQGLDPILNKIKENVRKRAAEFDISTPKGRTAIIKLSVEVRDEKTALEKLRLNLVAEQKRKLTLVDEEAGRAWDELEALQKEIRKPLTDWENKDKERIAAHEAALALVLAARDKPFEGMTSAQVKERMDNLPELMNRDWQEYSERAIREVDSTRLQLETMYHLSLKTEKDAAELARFRAEEERQALIFQGIYQEAHEQNVAFDAAAKARKDAEEKAAKEKQKIIDDAAAAAKKAADEKIASDKALQDAETKRVNDLAAVEKIAKEAREQAAKDAKEALEKAERDKAAALKKQKDDAAAAQKVIDDAAAMKAAADKKRAENVAHQGKINREAMTCIQAALDEAARQGEDPSKMIIIAIAKGVIDHVKISY